MTRRHIITVNNAAADKNHYEAYEVMEPDNSATMRGNKPAFLSTDFLNKHLHMKHARA